MATREGKRLMDAQLVGDLLIGLCVAMVSFSLGRLVEERRTLRGYQADRAVDPHRIVVPTSPTAVRGRGE